MSLSEPRTTRTGHRRASRAAHHAWLAACAASGAGRGARPIGRVDLQPPPAVRRAPDRPADRVGHRLGGESREPGILREGPPGDGGDVREARRDARRVRRDARGAARVDLGPDVVEGEGAEALRRQPGERKPDEAAQRGAEDVDGVQRERIEQREHVGDVLRDRVGARRPAALPAAPEVERQAAVAPRQPRRDRVERVTLLREPVEEEHGLRPGSRTAGPLARTLPVLEVEPHPVESEPLVRVRAEDLAHRDRPEAVRTAASASLVSVATSIVRM